MMGHNDIVAHVADHVQQEMVGVCAAHDFYHIDRVRTLAKKLQQKETRGDLLTIEVGALLHESLDTKFHDEGDMEQRKQDLASMLTSLELDDERISNIMFIVENVGYGKSLERTDSFVGTPEFEIVEDADRLESIGAIAIARTFSYGGKKGRPIHDPHIVPNRTLSRTSYVKENNTGINHFYEKLLLLKDLMHTVSGKEIAAKRHTFMEQYFEQFYREWNLEDM